jgi:hypothetical protein
MAKTKLEVIFIEKSDTAPGFQVLGDFSADSDGTLPTLHIGEIGDFQDVDLPGKVFSGRILDKSIQYTVTDTAGKTWDFVTRITITLQLVSGAPDPRFAEVNQGFQRTVKA